MADLFLLILIPLIGSLLSFLIGFYNKKIACWFSTGVCATTFLLAWKIDVLQVHYQYLFTWFTFDSAKVDFALRSGDPMPYLVTGIGTLIHLFSIEYMSDDESKHRFFAYLNLFIASMLILVLGANLPTLFIGWEGVGLCSYLLIGFWFTNPEYVKAAQKAFIFNRIGDLGLIIAIVLSLWFFHTTDFVDFNNSLDLQVISYLMAFSILFAAIGKSAQFPLFTWLPDAMAGPTPVSALIHAATMVTAGIYLIIKTYVFFALSQEIIVLLLGVGSMTAVIAGLLACTQKDIKKVLAYSTVSQLGFIFIALGLGHPKLAMFHLLTHAFFKACLFLTAGSIIQGCHHEQNMDNFGGLYKKMPVSFICYLAATISIAGIYPTAGYFSKHAIIEGVGDPSIKFIVIFMSLLTAVYMFRSLILTFFGEYKGKVIPHESGILILIPISILAILSLVGGFWLMSYPQYVGEHHHATILSGIIGSWAPVLSFGLCLLFIAKKVNLSKLSNFIQGSFDFDAVYDRFIVGFFRLSAKFFYNILDKVIDGTVTGVGQMVELSGYLGKFFQTGSLTVYINLLMLSVFGLIIICVVL